MTEQEPIKTNRYHNDDRCETRIIIEWFNGVVSYGYAGYDGLEGGAWSAVCAPEGCEDKKYQMAFDDLVEFNDKIISMYFEASCRVAKMTTPIHFRLSPEIRVGSWKIGIKRIRMFEDASWAVLETYL